MRQIKISIQKLLIVMILYITFQSSTIFNRPNRYVAMAFGALVILGILSRKVKICSNLSFIHYLSLIILGYMVLNVLQSETLLKSGYFTLLLFSTIMIIFIKWNSSAIAFYMKWIERLLFFFCLTIYLNWIIKGLMTNILSFIVISDSSRRVLVSEIAAGQYSGILAERSCASVAAVLGMGLSFAKYLADNKRERKHLLLVCYYFLALILTGKRSPIIIVVVAIVCALLMVRYSNKGIRLPFMILGVAVSAYLVAMYFPPVQAIIQRTQTLFDNDMALNGRDVLWSLAMKMYHENPWFGTGINSFNTKFSAWGIWGNAWGSHAHNTYIQLLGETGIIGCILFVLLFVGTLVMSIRLVQTKDLYRYKDLNLIAIFAFFIEIFWLGYGLSGNPFYYLEQRVMYFTGIALMLYVRDELGFRMRKEKEMNRTERIEE